MVVLIILDGLGVPSSKDSTFWEAKRGNFEYLEKFFPFTTLQASGIAVGLSWGEEGNSEVGHLTLGAGKTLYHHLPRISVSIQDKTFFDMDTPENNFKNLKELEVLFLKNKDKKEYTSEYYEAYHNNF
ncbi:MAG: 2,3-bisphosphoglycerate-independent phosphoglycerate mutase, partial [Patescibacteria group bacterium]